MLACKAWKSLKPVVRAIYIEVAQRYNGSNNGNISFSVRQAAEAVHCSKDTASNAFHELEDKGFLKRNVCGSFDWKKRHATTWILTVHPYKNQLATKDFMRWRDDNLKPGPKKRTVGHHQRTKRPKLNGFPLNHVPHSGPKH